LTKVSYTKVNPITFQDLQHQFPGISVRKTIYEHFSGPCKMRKAFSGLSRKCRKAE